MELMDRDSSGGMELLLKLGPDPHDLDALMMLLYAQLKLRDSMPDERSKGPSGGPGPLSSSASVSALGHEVLAEQDPRSPLLLASQRREIVAPTEGRLLEPDLCRRWCDVQACSQAGVRVDTRVRWICGEPCSRDRHRRRRTCPRVSRLELDLVSGRQKRVVRRARLRAYVSDQGAVSHRAPASATHQPGTAGKNNRSYDSKQCARILASHCGPAFLGEVRTDGRMGHPYRLGRDHNSVTRNTGRCDSS